MDPLPRLDSSRIPTSPRARNHDCHVDRANNERHNIRRLLIIRSWTAHWSYLCVWSGPAGQASWAGVFGDQAGEWISGFVLRALSCCCDSSVVTCCLILLFVRPVLGDREIGAITPRATSLASQIGIKNVRHLLEWAYFTCQYLLGLPRFIAFFVYASPGITQP